MQQLEKQTSEDKQGVLTKKDDAAGILDAIENIESDDVEDDESLSRDEDSSIDLENKEKNHTVQTAEDEASEGDWWLGSDEGTQPLVTIIGITGYVGSHACLAFLMDRGFRVRGTVRDIHDATKITPLKRACLDLWSELEVVEANLMDADSINKAIEGSDFVVHIASPKVYEKCEFIQAKQSRVKSPDGKINSDIAIVEEEGEEEDDVGE